MDEQWSDYYKVRWYYDQGGCSGWFNFRFECIEDADMFGAKWVAVVALQSEESAKASNSLYYYVQGFNRD